MRMTFSCWKCKRILISRRVRFVSVRCSKALLIFLIATFSPVVLSSALHTTPYAPCPIGLRSVYRPSTSKRVPHTMNELILRASPLVAVDDAAAAGAKASGAGGTGCMPACTPRSLRLSNNQTRSVGDGFGG